MMYDLQTQFSSAQAITASAASTNYIDLNSIKNIGVGQDLNLVAIVTTAFTDSGSDSTVTISVQTDDNSSFSSAATLLTLNTLAALTAAGTTRIAKLPQLASGSLTTTSAGGYERYMQLYYTVANGNLTTGAITAFLSLDVQAWTPYASGFSIS